MKNHGVTDEAIEAYIGNMSEGGVRTLQIVQALLDKVRVKDIVIQFEITRARVYEIKAKYVTNSKEGSK